MPKKEGLKKVLILGSGAIKIGEAGEFDYSGSQCLKALREEGIDTVLVNPNIATIQTDTRLAGKVYLLPVTPEYVERVIENEKVDGLLLSFGGQTALNCGVQLAKRGILEKYGVKVLGTPIRGIEVTEDRALFCKVMNEAGVTVPRSKEAYSLEEARQTAKKLGYPAMIRVAYTLGGRGGGVAHNEYELDEIAERGLVNSLTHQILVEEYLGELKQIEYEVMRDQYGNSVTVCNMENVLGMRVHTGDNVVIAPSQTLTNREYHSLRTMAIKAAEACGIIGECNIQFALDNKSEKYYAIEINARLSRSSALASKATGYPLAYMAAKLALGYSLSELTNKVTGVTSACFEPSLDYVVLKFPRWDLKKFERVSRHIGTQMKSVGEVMAIGRCFEAVLQKSIRMLDIGRDGLVDNSTYENASRSEALEDRLTHPTDDVLFHVAQALAGNMDTAKLEKLTWIDPWFLSKMKNIVDTGVLLRVFSGKPQGIDLQLMGEAKRLGFSDRQIASLTSSKEDEIRAIRKKLGVIPSVKQIDTLAAEWPAKTNYLYVTYGGREDDVDFSDAKKAIVLGAGCYRIGSSVEFDWGTMNMVWALKDLGFQQVIVVNCNPETVSTDYDMSDKLYFEELTLERILDIYEKERPEGVVACVGSQIANNLATKLAQHGVKILGTDSKNIDRAEDRSKFSQLLDELSIPQPPWRAFTSLEDAHSFARKVGYPVLVRPSYVLSGAAMKVVYTSSQLEQFLASAAMVSPEYPVVISKFITDAMEVEVDAVSDGYNTYIGAVIEHLEKAGIHSGDATMVIPPQKIDAHIQSVIEDYAARIGRSLNIKGPFNIQFLVKNDRVYVIECNLRASRSMPFVSKVTGVNLMKIAASAVIGESVAHYAKKKWAPVRVGVKVPQFSFMQLEGADPHLGVEMQSTGEVACFGESYYDALLKAMAAGGYKLPKEGSSVLITVGGMDLKKQILPAVFKFKELGFKIFATEHTSDFLKENDVHDVTCLYKISEPSRTPNLKDYLTEGKLDLIVNIPSTTALEKYVEMLEDEYQIRRKAVELGIPVLTTIEAASVFTDALAWLRINTPSVEAIGHS
ncbi:MAG: carbamoyl-phosphate synthase (glutamine-hydrolyzing) large subunit [Thaumarchaeota archaeon]|nr:carbamoyl-phosphate synthase (glutamine-hydrolyzing) large subunit [Nitrososphaerota archaeon]